MAGEATLAIKLSVTGIGDDTIVQDSIDLTVPVKKLEGYIITTGATATAIALLANITGIALAKVYGVYIEAEVGTIFVTLQTDGTTGSTALTTSADLVLNVGEACYLPYNWNKTGVAGIQVNGSSATDAFSYVILGKA
jgi:hypothetical protein